MLTISVIVIDDNWFKVEFDQHWYEVKTDGNGGGRIASNLKMPVDAKDSSADYNHAIDGIEALILAHACAGIDVTDNRYINGVYDAAQTAAETL